MEKKFEIIEEGRLSKNEMGKVMGGASDVSCKPANSYSVVDKCGADRSGTWLVCGDGTGSGYSVSCMSNQVCSPIFVACTGAPGNYSVDNGSYVTSYSDIYSSNERGILDMSKLLVV
jgi:hypothetical protein